jgi:hypothetical protein
MQNIAKKKTYVSANVFSFASGMDSRSFVSCFSLLSFLRQEYRYSGKFSIHRIDDGSYDVASCETGEVFANFRTLPKNPRIVQ